MPTVSILQGKLKGGECVTENGFKYNEFLGIPYAKPPLGDLRFKSPQSPEPWVGERDATSAAVLRNNIASQVHFVDGQISGSEDCLYLNVFTPILPPDSKSLPVIVCIHGGGFIGGNGTIKEENGPDFLIENDVVVVTINYRLGVFGFLALDMPEAAGNMGLKDMIKALLWIQSNIDKFGGNKNNVTILGISAGSAAVEYLILSPVAKNLFHRAILQSGSCLNDWAINLDPKALVKRLVEQLGYEGSKDNNHAIYEFLLGMPASELTGAAFQVAENFTTKKTFFGFVPTIEQDFGNGDAFLVEHPYKLLKNGNFNQVPVIKGFCMKEGSLITMMKPLAVNELSEKKNFAECWSYEFEADDIEKYNKEFLGAYLEGTQSTDSDWAVDFFGDLNFSSGIWIAGRILSSKGVPVYMYKFSYDGNINAFKVVYGIMKKGAMHGDDVTYVFRHDPVTSIRVPNDSDKLMRSRMTKMWTNFAWGRVPTENCAGVPNWPEFTELTPVYLNIDKEFTIETDYEPNKMAVFEEIYDKYVK